MTTNLPRSGLSPPMSDTAAAASRTSSSSLQSYNQQQPPRTASRTAFRKTTTEAGPSDAYNDKNAVALIRRVLCPDVSSSYGSNTPRPLQELLPPLTSSNEVDLQLYALLAIIIKEFVYSWYAKITTDRGFVDEVLQLIAHCTRALEQRLRQVDVKQLVLDEIPALVEAHIAAYRTAKQGSSLVCVPAPTRVIYHQLNPHPSLSPPPDSLDSPSSPELLNQQQQNESLYRHLLAQSVLAVLLPTEDLENVCLRTLVEDILADLLLGNEVSGKLCEGWFIWAAVSKAIRLSRQRATDPEDSAIKPSKGDTLNRLERFGLLSDELAKGKSTRNSSQPRLMVWIWKVLYTIFPLLLALRFVVGGLLRVGMSSAEASTTDAATPDQSHPVKPPTVEVSCRPVLDYRSFALISQWIGLSHRMPWLTGSLSLVQTLVLKGPGKVGATNSVVDRFLRELIDTYILTPELAPTLLLAARTTLFPSNSRPNNAVSTRQQQQQHGASKADTPPGQQSESAAPSDDEIAAIKRQCATDILSLIPRPIAQVYIRGTIPKNECDTAELLTSHVKNNKNGSTKPDSHDHNHDHDHETSTSNTSASPSLQPAATSCDAGTEDEQQLLHAIETDLLDPFSDAYCNKHLIFAVIESVLVKLLPEISEQGVTELMEERGVVV